VATAHMEIERKYDVDVRFVLPDLIGADGVTGVDGPEEHALEAVYFDTPDLRLARARITLRRRTGGTDPGWHLKLPADAGARRELHAPPGRSARTPPRAVLTPVAGILRGVAPGPVVRLQTRRVVTALRGAGGGVRAEVADDTVTATRLAPEPGEAAEVQTWREVEVELVDGDEPVLTAVGALLAAAGARPSASPSKLARALGSALTGDGSRPAGGKGRPTAGEVVLGAVRAQVAALQAADVMVRTEQPDAVHKLRVAGRRLRSIFAAFRSVLDREVTEPLRAELKWLGLEVSAARDDEVALDHLRRLLDEQPVELVLGPVAARLQQTEIREAREDLDRALATLADPRYLRLLDELHLLPADPPFADAAGRPARQVLHVAVRRGARRLRRRVTAAEQAAPAERAAALHEVRKAAKRVRYTAEVAAPELGSATKTLVDRMEQVQDTLGERQDTVVTREHCRRLGIAASAAGENGFTYGRLEALEEARADRAEWEFWASWPKIGKRVKAATA
jgi:CHAD domain-containing protein